jgi:RimJ/RimL family protein N-acetyltransferase
MALIIDWWGFYKKDIIMTFFSNQSNGQPSPRRFRIILLFAFLSLIPIGYPTYRLAFYLHKPKTILTTPPQEINGKIVTLRPLQEEFFISFHNMFSNLVRKNLEFPEFITLGYTIRYLQDLQRKVKEGKMLLYCIFDNKDNKLIGAINIKEKNESELGQLGWWINEAYWGGGRAQEALNLMSKTYFKLKPHEKSYIAHVRLWNKRGYLALKKNGFQDVGYFYEGGKPTRYILERKPR